MACVEMLFTHLITCEWRDDVGGDALHCCSLSPRHLIVCSLPPDGRLRGLGEMTSPVTSGKVTVVTMVTVVAKSVRSITSGKVTVVTMVTVVAKSVRSITSGKVTVVTMVTVVAKSVRSITSGKVTVVTMVTVVAKSVRSITSGKVTVVTMVTVVAKSVRSITSGKVTVVTMVTVVAKSVRSITSGKVTVVTMVTVVAKSVRSITSGKVTVVTMVTVVAKSVRSITSGKVTSPPNHRSHSTLPSVDNIIEMLKDAAAANRLDELLMQPADELLACIAAPMSPCHCVVIHDKGSNVLAARAWAIKSLAAFYTHRWVDTLNFRLKAGEYNWSEAVPYEALSFEPPSKHVPRLHALLAFFAHTAAGYINSVAATESSPGADAAARPAATAAPEQHVDPATLPSLDGPFDAATWGAAAFDPLVAVYGRDGRTTRPPNAGLTLQVMSPIMFPGKPKIEGHFLYLWGKVYVQLREYAMAIRFFNLVLCFCPRLLMAHSRRGFCHSRSGMYDHAIADCSAGIAVADPRHVYIRSILHYNLGIGFQNVSRREDSLASYDTAIALAPDMVDAYCNRAITAELLHRYAATRADYTTALELDPYDRGVLLWRAEMYRDVGDADRAIADVLHAFSLNSAFVYRDLYAFRAFSMRQPSLLASPLPSLVAELVDAAVKHPVTHVELWNAVLAALRTDSPESSPLPSALVEALLVAAPRALVEARAGAGRALVLKVLKLACAVGVLKLSARLLALLAGAVLLEPLGGLKLNIAGLFVSLLLREPAAEELPYSPKDIASSRTLESTVDRLGVSWLRRLAELDENNGEVPDGASPAAYQLCDCDDANCRAPGIGAVHALLHDWTPSHWRLFRGTYLERWAPVVVATLMEAPGSELTTPHNHCYTCGSSTHRTFMCATCPYCTLHPWRGVDDMTSTSEDGSSSDIPMLWCTDVPIALVTDSVSIDATAVPDILYARHAQLANLFVGAAAPTCWTPFSKRIASWSLVTAVLVTPQAYCSSTALVGLVRNITDELRSRTPRTMLIGVIVLQVLLSRPINRNIRLHRALIRTLVETNFITDLFDPVYTRFNLALENLIAFYESVDHAAAIQGLAPPAVDADIDLVAAFELGLLSITTNLSRCDVSDPALRHSFWAAH
ncbi:tetratricopeptide repeat domain-containing protein [Thecamonas trahens ATCC 50062]|uniref:Tetratricopeptide repeat domain-containing protein n=1 Tax=Thecamonas trahens ATCC 50062 TaxID=461836 RepID=A0A0L0DSE4_THETB|nr:tetratricopeptide repeat domain-containing protein [Thecamonas trahens ATCC 50062]KNC55190.1 tetratricopeptide repeat domain-containing protein [Thecamonas trahens ATCC 50062]|eukprot:XP_013753242.1 tetratricopeptide repeat domain-containing protein [Thecamonas trahens ATCC 50062]